MVKPVPGPSKGAIDRITDLENALETLRGQLGKDLQGFVDAFQRVGKHLSVNEQRIMGLIDAVGLDKVEESIRKLSKQEEQDRVAAAQESVAKALADGNIVAQEIVEENSFLVGCEKNAQGEPTGPSRFYQPVVDLNPDVQALVLGKTVGDVIQLSAGSLEIFEIYKAKQPE